MTQRYTEEAIYWARHHLAGWRTGGRASEWIERSRTGLDDAELKAALAEEFGIWGGSGGPGTWWSEHAGGAEPWLEVSPTCRKRDAYKFKGTDLLTLAREVFGVAKPGERQLPLF